MSSPNFQTLPLNVAIEPLLPPASALRSWPLRTSRGSVMTPVTAEAATVAGEPMKISAFGLPMRPLKFRVEAVMHTSSSASSPICPPKQAPHVELVTTAPASIRVST